jgi:FkbM family methyltransferase
MAAGGSENSRGQMDTLRRWVRQLRATIRRRKFPEMAVVQAFTMTCRFRVYNAVERYRVVMYGGERHVLERFLSGLEPTDVVFDIGASVGLYTVFAASILNQGQVYAFEPDPSTYARLQENVRLNQLDNVKFIPWAVSDREGEVMLYTDGVEGFAPSIIHQERQGAPTGEVRVPACSLDIALSRGELSPPDILKVDVEGAEALCLLGCRQILNGEFGRRPRKILLELHPAFLPSFQSSPNEIKSFLDGLGYKLEWAEQRAEQEHLFYTYSL